jgi:hypothetical protein
MTYYKIKKYLMQRGLSEGQADRVRGMIREMINAPGELGIADVWHEGSKSYYRAKLFKKLTPEEAEFDPTESVG